MIGPAPPVTGKTKPAPQRWFRSAGPPPLTAGDRLTRAEFERHAAETAEPAHTLLTPLGRAAELIQSFRQVAVDQSHRERRRFRVAKYLDEIMTSLSPELKRTSHQVLVRCPVDLEMVAPPGVLYQIVTNLVLNSLAHAYPNGRVGQMALEVSAEHGRLRLVYQDDGVGMTDDVRRRLKYAFFGDGIGHLVRYADSIARAVRR